MKTKAIFGGAAIFFILIGMTIPARADITHAVIVGIADYKYVSDLFLTVNDANHIYDRCLWYGGNVKGIKRNVKLLTDRKAKKSAIKRKCQGMVSRIKAGETCLFYFSGHGWNGPDLPPYDEMDGLDEYLCAYDSLLYSYDNDIRDDELDEWLSPAVDKGANVVVILDTCYSGGAIKRKVKIKDEDVELLVKTKGGQPEVTITDDFAKDIDKPGFWVMTACDDNEPAYEWPWYQMSEFTFIVDLAFSGQADDTWLAGGIGDDNGHITYDEVVAAIIPLDDKFYSFLTWDQHPQFYSGGTNIDLFTLR